MEEPKAYADKIFNFHKKKLNRILSSEENKQLVSNLEKEYEKFKLVKCEKITKDIKEIENALIKVKEHKSSNARVNKDKELITAEYKDNVKQLQEMYSDCIGIVKNNLYELNLQLDNVAQMNYGSYYKCAKKCFSNVEGSDYLMSGKYKGEICVDSCGERYQFNIDVYNKYFQERIISETKRAINLNH